MNKVRYYETDQMGFVHHSNYLKYFEMARIEWFDFLDIRYVELEKKIFGCLLLNAQFHI